MSYATLNETDQNWWVELCSAAAIVDEAAAFIEAIDAPSWKAEFFDDVRGLGVEVWVLGSDPVDVTLDELKAQDVECDSHAVAAAIRTRFNLG